MKLVVLAILVAACGSRAQPAAVKPKVVPLYDRLGGMDVIDAIVKDFVEVRIAKDDRIADRFKNADLPRLKLMLADQICELSGGPCKYVGKNMREAHAGIGIGDAEVRVFLEDLRAALAAHEIPAREGDELVELLAKSKPEIVEAQ